MTDKIAELKAALAGLKAALEGMEGMLDERLKSLGWKQQRIADAKDIARTVVSRRLKFHSMPDRVKDSVRKGLLDEFHLEEIGHLSAADTLSLWLTTSQAWKELAEKAVHDRGKNQKGRRILKSLVKNEPIGDPPKRGC